MNKEKGIAHIIIIAAVAVVILAGGIWFFTHQKNATNTPAIQNQANAISGTIDLNGIAPQGSTIAIAQKDFGKNDFTTVIENITPQDHATWSWAGAQSGREYQLVAYLKSSDGNNIASSNIATAASPAKNIGLTINIASTQQTGNATISGTLDINGYIPPQSTLAFWGKKASDANYILVVDNLPPTDNYAWSWNKAQSGVSYNVKAVISQGGKVVASSAPRLITAPASDEVIRVVSTVNPGTVVSGNGVISGNVNFNGIAPSGSSVVIVARPSGTTAYKVVVSGVSAQNGASWSWNQAILGQMYDLQAVLKVNGNDFAISNTITVAAPAFNETFTLNSNVQQPQPPQSPFYSCVGQSNGLWAVSITFNYVTVSGQQASQYWVRLGDPNSDNRYLDTRVTAQNQPGQTQQAVTSPYSLGNGGNYYAKYAYSTSPTSGNLSDFSAWSTTTAVTCPQPSNPTPTPTLGPGQASCNQTCGSNGYTCITGLQCVESEVIGGSVCRNPNCTAQTNCTCI